MESTVALESAGPTSPTGGGLAAATLRPFAPPHREAVYDLLCDLPKLYPGAELWLPRRLDEVLEGLAECTLAISSGHLVGLTILKPKTTWRWKMCTIYVHPASRHRGVGSSLLDWSMRSALEQEVRELYITADVHTGDPVRRLFGRRGFREIDVAFNRYGSDRHETVLEWSHPSAPPLDGEPPTKGL